ncbi:FYVE zinc finger domain-containing protein [Phytophthora infestans]|uniref:FYVE zinc finger domain-containing protein n=1 Tax=Phytophthora infestans TaxID=4787 RepID=A0A8S9THF6_PHYIN|nr:FYVE zinc finger domain-containing protein [Phytophthora infestans]
MDRVLSSPTKQKALVRLMSSDPSLLDGLDNDVLASITLLSDPPEKAWDRRPTLLKRESRRNNAERKTIQLYPEDAVFAEKKKPTLTLASGGISHAKKATLVRANTVLLSPSSNATALAASTRSKQDGRTDNGFWTEDSSTMRHTSVARRSTFYPAVQRQKPPPVILFDDSMLNVEDRGTKDHQGNGRSGSTKKRAKRMRRRERKLGSSSGSSSNSSTNKSEDESNQQEAEKSRLVSVMMTRGSASVESDSDDGVQAASAITSSVVCDSRLASSLVSRDQWNPRSARKSCYVCLREFNVLRKRHSCRMCGEIICSRCSVYREVHFPVLENKLRICSCCFVAYRKKLEEDSQHSYGEDTDADDGSADHRESAARGGSLAVSNSELRDPSASNAVSFQVSPSLSPSENTSDRSSSRNTINTMSDLSFSSDTVYETFSSGSFCGSRNTEEELEAVLKAKQLEKEVEASQQRIQVLEAQIATQESHQDLLSTEQQAQLGEARATIKILQEKLCMQEVNARQAAHNRDSICLSKLRQTELYANENDESAALKKKLTVLERQLKQAGISVAEVIPYELAKRKVAEVSRRLQEIGSSEVVLEDKQAQAAARKEYYILEQEMEKYHMALVMTDEYIEEQRRQEKEWEDANEEANVEALLLLRSAIPVDISRLSEKELNGLVTPTGATFPAELARRLKRTNVLQLLRTDPKTIVKMHPSVIEGYRTTGLTLLERRALHAVLKEPFKEWKKQQKDAMAQKKFAWYCKLKEAFVTAATNLKTHCNSTSGHDFGNIAIVPPHKCELMGLACPVRSEEKVRKLYCGLGFTPEAEFIKEDILKSDPENAGEKALLEAQTHVREMVANQRQRDLKAHYKTKMREIAQAVGALEDMDSIMEQIRALDDSFPSVEGGELEQQNQCNSLLNSARELTLLLAKRAGICITGKRDPAKDEADTRSPVEIREACQAIVFLQEVLADVKALLFNDEGFLRESHSITATATFKAVGELVDDVRKKNSAAMGDEIISVSGVNRAPWAKRNVPAKSVDQQLPFSSSSNDRPAALPTSAPLFDAIKARRKQKNQRVSTRDSFANKIESPMETPRASKPLDLMAAIRARKRAQSGDTTQH